METKLKNRIMRRIQFIFYCRSTVSKVALKIYITLILLWGFIPNVSLMNVFKNTKNLGSMDAGHVLYFYKYAFMNTELVVQTISVAVFILAVFILGNNIKGLLFRTPQRQA